MNRSIKKRGPICSNCRHRKRQVNRCAEIAQPTVIEFGSLKARTDESAEFGRRCRNRSLSTRHSSIGCHMRGVSANESAEFDAPARQSARDDCLPIGAGIIRHHAAQRRPQTFDDCVPEGGRSFADASLKKKRSCSIASRRFRKCFMPARRRWRIDAIRRLPSRVE